MAFDLICFDNNSEIMFKVNLSYSLGLHPTKFIQMAGNKMWQILTFCLLMVKIDKLHGQAQKMFYLIKEYCRLVFM